jgi:hypothetical protein
MPMPSMKYLKKRCHGHGSLSAKYMLNKRIILYFIIGLVFIPSLNMFSQNILISSSTFEEKRIENKKMLITADISGITQAYEEYDIKANFDGQIISIKPELFDVIESSEAIIRVVTGEVAALLKTATDEKEKDDILKRWDGMFKYTDMRSPTEGIVVKIYVKANDFVNKGDRILRIAKKMRVIAKNKNKLFIQPQIGLNGIINRAFNKYKITLTNYIPNEDYYYTLLFDFDEIPDIKIGERVEGVMMMANRQNTRVVSSKDVINYNGKKYLIIQFEPGLITEDETEVLGFTLNYLSIKSSPSQNDISNQKQQ